MEGIKTASVPRARPDIHYLNGLLSLLRGKWMDPKVKRADTHSRRKQIRLVLGSFQPHLFWGLREVLPEHFSFSRASRSLS